MEAYDHNHHRVGSMRVATCAYQACLHHDEGTIPLEKTELQESLRPEGTPWSSLTPRLLGSRYELDKHRVKKHKLSSLGHATIRIFPSMAEEKSSLIGGINLPAIYDVEHRFESTMTLFKLKEYLGTH